MLLSSVFKNNAKFIELEKFLNVVFFGLMLYETNFWFTRWFKM